MHRIVFLFFVSAVVHIAVAEGANAGAPATRDPEAFSRAIDALRRKAQIPGLSVAVVENDAIVFARGYGLADVERGVEATAETPYDIASVAKPLSAVVALRLVESGDLDLDRPMAEYSDWAGFCAEFSRQISIFARNLNCSPAKHTLRHLLSHTAEGDPGTRFSYNPVLYSWASRPIMAVAKEAFSTLVQQFVFAPAHMNDSARKHRDLPLRDDLAARQAQPYRVEPNGEVAPAPAARPQGDGAAGGVVSTVLDLAAFDLALDRDVLLSPQSRLTMMTPTNMQNGTAAPYGLGWYVQAYRGHRLLWHSGWWEDAYSALYLKVPDLSLSFIALANSEGIWWGNPLEAAAVENSAFARVFLAHFVDERLSAVLPGDAE